MYPHPSSSSSLPEDDEDMAFGQRELVGLVWFFKWLVRITLTCAWLWVIMSAMVIGMVDSCYAGGNGFIAWTVFAFMFMLLIPTCGRGPCRSVHGEWPSALLVAAVIVTVFSAQASRKATRWSHYECF